MRCRKHGLNIMKGREMVRVRVVQNVRSRLVNFGIENKCEDVDAFPKKWGTSPGASTLP